MSGMIDINLFDGFVPSIGASFEVVTGQSMLDEGVSIVGPDAHSFIYSIVNGNSLVLVYTDADFDSGGSIDGGDFLTWQEGFGLTSASHSQGDADGNNLVDHNDLLAWQNGFGFVTAASASSSVEVPEPSTVSIVIFGLILSRGWPGGIRRGRPVRLGLFELDKKWS